MNMEVLPLSIGDLRNSTPALLPCGDVGPALGPVHPLCIQGAQCDSSASRQTVAHLKFLEFFSMLNN